MGEPDFCSSCSDFAVCYRNESCIDFKSENQRQPIFPQCYDGSMGGANRYFRSGLDVDLSAAVWAFEIFSKPYQWWQNNRIRNFK